MSPRVVSPCGGEVCVLSTATPALRRVRLLNFSCYTLDIEVDWWVRVKPLSVGRPPTLRSDRKLHQR